MKAPRRTILAVALVATAGLTAASAPALADNGERHARIVVDQPLRELAKRADLRVGTAVDMNALNNDATYKARVASEFSEVTPENVMKWGEVEKVRGNPDYTLADQLVNFARDNGQKVRGHTLLWHNQLPTWLTDGVANGSIGAAELRNILRQHIFDEAGHFRGKIWHWDVVNEVIDDSGQLRNTIFLQLLGPGYIADAFRWAHQADPKAKLYLNDYNIEFPGIKADAYFTLVQQLLADRVPVDGLGAQGHLGIQFGLPSANDIFTNLKRFQDLGLEISLTEVDVRMILPVDNVKLQAQAQGFSALMQGCLLLKDCVAFVVWGFTDKYNWVPGVFTGQGAATPLDENFNAKPAYRALQAALAFG
jgi:endo-1,4-beta-xylanase